MVDLLERAKKKRKENKALVKFFQRRCGGRKPLGIRGRGNKPQPESSAPQVLPIELPWSGHYSNRHDPRHCEPPATMAQSLRGHSWDSWLTAGKEKVKSVLRVFKEKLKVGLFALFAAPLLSHLRCSFNSSTLGNSLELFCFTSYSPYYSRSAGDNRNCRYAWFRNSRRVSPACTS